MTGSFLSALGGLRAHQSWIDVIGHNLANSNTPGFKSSRALFSDLLSVTRRPATPPTGNLGGTNPLQIGLGVQLAAVDRRLEQGGMNLTGRTFDLALLGRGYFALTDGTQNLYSRVGTFGLDASGNMVDMRTGYRVLDASGQTFSVDTSAVFPPRATTQMTFAGNLPAVVTGPLAEELTSSSSFTAGTAAQMTGTNAGPFDIPAGETWTMELVIDGGAPQAVSIPGSGPITAQEIADEINAQTEDVVAALSPTGEIVLTTERAGLSATIKVNAGEAGKDLKETLGLVDFVQGSETPATEATDLNDLAANRADYESGDVIDISGTDVDGSPVVSSFVYGVDGTTLGDLVAHIGDQFGQSTVTFDPATGQISILSDTLGEADLSLSLGDGASQTGSTDWATHFFAVTTNGTGPDTVTTSLEVFDSAGTSHILTFEFERQGDGTWNMTTEVPASEGTVVDGAITGISFNENGSILTPTGGDIQVQFGTLSSQTVALDFGTSGQFDGITQFGNAASLVADHQDGYGAGELASLQVDEQGVIEGFYTNGQTQELADVGVATFANEAGLEAMGDNYFRSTANTGQRILGAGTLNGAGEVVAGAIEASNVDTAVEFVHLIEAQRGFQANARVITVQDELLAEIVNVV
ncbi:MAG: flagellar hook-basal body complex protein [Planctomycetota bacterium]